MTLPCVLAPTHSISFTTAAQPVATWQPLLVPSSFFPQFQAPELPTHFSLFCLGSRLPTQEIEFLPRLPTRVHGREVQRAEQRTERVSRSEQDFKPRT